MIEFQLICTGSTKTDKPMEFYTCLTCGAAVIEKERRDDARQLHTSHHRRP